jgi:hypothetical protein
LHVFQFAEASDDKTAGEGIENTAKCRQNRLDVELFLVLSCMVMQADVGMASWIERISPSMPLIPFLLPSRVLDSHGQASGVRHDSMTSSTAST